jgi:hypothetical protein
VLASRAGVEARVKERQLHVLERRGAGEEIESLEDEADLGVADLGEGVAGEVRDVLAVEHVASGGGAVEAAEEIHEGGLAGARRAHDRHEVARANLQGDLAEGMHDLTAHAIVLGQLVCLDERAAHD